MGRQAKLTALFVQKLIHRGRYGDGGGLWLQVSKSGSKSWLFRFMLRGRSREMGIGSLGNVTLAEARELARECRRCLAQGGDPIQLRAERIRKDALESVKTVTFDECTKLYLNEMSGKWKNLKHQTQWENTLRTYASPIIGRVGVQHIDTSQILQILRPIWKIKTETASRVRGRIEAVLDFAAASEWRKGQNPGRWRGHLDKLLASRTELMPVVHHAALPVSQIQSFTAQLKLKKSTAARALELLILTVLRPGELVGGTWDEIDFENKIWTVPASRMKIKSTHRVPLVTRAIQLLEGLKQIQVDSFIFQGLKANSHLTTASLLKLVKELSPDLDLTTHGFRSCFRDWAAEHTNVQNEVAEMCLAHAIGNKVEAAYRRGDLFLKRRKLMEKWSEFCVQPATIDNNNVVKIVSKLA